MLACKLIPRTPFHFGIREGLMEGTDIVLHSDTLFSAFCNSFLLLYGESKLEELLGLFLRGTPPFLFSSAFPFWKNEFFFPFPKYFFPPEKKFKKAKFIEKEGFQLLLKGDEKALQGEILNDIPIIPPEKEPHPFKVQTIPHVSLNRKNNSSQLFHSSKVFFQDGAGLFFLVDLKNSDYREIFLSVMRFLGDEGIGGDRSSGCGGFTPEFDFNFQLDIPQSPNSLCLLSLCFPDRNEEETLLHGYYDLVERKGYIFSPTNKTFRKRSVRMISEGSVFRGPNLKGTIIEVTPKCVQTPHPVFRYGLAFSVPCIWREDESKN